MRRNLLTFMMLSFTVAVFATFVIIKNDGTMVRLNLSKLPVEQSGESFTINGIDVNDIAHIYNKVWDDDDDYERAFTQGYLSSEYYTFDRKKQITSQEFKALLKPLVEKYSPDKMDYFESRITNYEAPLYRGVAACMAYYVARCIGVDTHNSTSERSTVEDLFDNLWDLPAFTDIMPYAPSLMEGGDQDEAVYAIFWNASHVSVVSGMEVIGFDTEEAKWSWNKPFTWENAVRAITRLHDSFEPEIEYASIDDERVTSPDASIITPELIAAAAEKEIYDIKDLPRLIGFLLGEEKMALEHPYRLSATERDIKEHAEWGFNSLKYGTSWTNLFNTDLQANLTVFKSLDEMVAAAMKYGVHLNFLLTSIPGYGMYFADDIRDNYVLDTDILNTEKRKNTAAIWKAIATRYKDVPNANLSFGSLNMPRQLYDLGGFGEGQTFTIDQILDFADVIIDAIKEVTPERFIFYESFSMDLPNKDNSYLTQAFEQQRHMTEKYTNTRPLFGHLDMAYMFYEYNTGDGNIDYAHHSVWVPTYPTTIYAGNSIIHDDHNLVIDGCLPKGTVINFYIKDAVDATMNIAADGNTLYEESLDGDFNMGYAMAVGEPFRKSDKLFSVTLDADAKEVTLSANSGAFSWCGIEVVLPESYAVEKWRKDSQWDVELGLIAEEDYHGSMYLKKTSTIQIGATIDDWSGTSGLHITINDDVTFTSDFVSSYSNKALTEQMVKESCENFPTRWSCIFEDILVTDMEGALNYWDDTMDVFQKYDVDVWISANGLLYEEILAPYRIADYEGENFNGHHNFNVKLLRVLQKYLDK